MYNKNDGIISYLDNVIGVISQLDTRAIAKCVNMLLQAYHNESTIFLFGNGGSGATASHFCGDLIKGASSGLKKRFKAICLNDNIPALMAIANDISYEEIFVEQLKNFVRKGDVVIGFSGSGNSNNVVKAIQYAKENEANTVAFCGFNGGKIHHMTDLSLHANVNDMEISEDIHMMLAHCIKQQVIASLTRELHGQTQHTPCAMGALSL